MKFLLLFLFSFIASVPMAYPAGRMAGDLAEAMPKTIDKFLRQVQNKLGAGGEVGIIKKAEDAVEFTVKGASGAATHTIKIGPEGLAGLERLSANYKTLTAAHMEAVANKNAAITKHADEATIKQLDKVAINAGREAEKAKKAYFEFAEKAAKGENIDRGLMKIKERGNLIAGHKLTTGEKVGIAAGIIGSGVVGGVAGAAIQKNIDENNMGW